MMLMILLIFLRIMELLQMNYDHFYFCLLFDLIKKLKNTFNVSIRTHIVDVESNFDFLKDKNVRNKVKI